MWTRVVFEICKTFLEVLKQIVKLCVKMPRKLESILNYLYDDNMDGSACMFGAYPSPCAYAQPTEWSNRVNRLVCWQSKLHAAIWGQVFDQCA